MSRSPPRSGCFVLLSGAREIAARAPASRATSRSSSCSCQEHARLQQERQHQGLHQEALRAPVGSTRDCCPFGFVATSGRGAFVLLSGAREIAAARVPVGAHGVVSPSCSCREHARLQRRPADIARVHRAPIGSTRDCSSRAHEKFQGSTSRSCRKPCKIPDGLLEDHATASALALRKLLGEVKLEPKYPDIGRPYYVAHTRLGVLNLLDLGARGGPGGGGEAANAGSPPPILDDGLGPESGLGSSCGRSKPVSDPGTHALRWWRRWESNPGPRTVRRGVYVRIRRT